MRRSLKFFSVYLVSLLCFSWMIVNVGTTSPLIKVLNGSYGRVHMDSSVLVLNNVIIPRLMQCNTGNVCVSCSQVDSLYNNFMTSYPGNTPTQAAPDIVQQLKNTFFANFMNNRWVIVNKPGNTWLLRRNVIRPESQRARVVVPMW